MFRRLAVASLYVTLTSFWGLDAAEIRHASHMSPHARPIVILDNHVFVANTPADTVDIISVKSQEVVARVPVGIDPVGLAVRPDGRQVWVANHISDSISVIDTNSKSPTYHKVIGTVQDIDSSTKSTRFD